MALCSTGAGGKGPGTQGGRGDGGPNFVSSHCSQPSQLCIPTSSMLGFPCRTLLQDRLRANWLTCAKNLSVHRSEHQESTLLRSGQASSGDHVTHSRCLDPGIGNPAHCAQPLELCLLSCEMQCNTRSQVLDGENHQHTLWSNCQVQSRRRNTFTFLTSFTRLSMSLYL